MLFNRTVVIVGYSPCVYVTSLSPTLFSLSNKCRHQFSLIFSFQFAKRLLQGVDLIGALIPGCEGATIAAEMLDASESLRELCAKCGAKLTSVQCTLITCTGICLPRRTFHSKCVPETRHADPTFKCLVCDPSKREDFCFRCNTGLTNDIVLCSRNNNNGCTNFVHRTCVARMRNEFTCGLC